MRNNPGQQGQWGYMGQGAGQAQQQQWEFRGNGRIATGHVPVIPPQQGGGNQFIPQGNIGGQFVPRGPLQPQNQGFQQNNVGPPN